MVDFAVAHNYARSLINIAVEQKAVESWEEELASVDRLLETASQVKKILLSPMFDRAKREKILASLLTPLNLSDPVRLICILLLRQEHLSLFSEILFSYRTLSQESLKKKFGLVKSAHPLSDEQKKEITRCLQKLTDHVLVLDYHTDKELLGGFQIQLGSLLFDSSLAKSLEDLKTYLLSSSERTLRGNNNGA